MREHTSLACFMAKPDGIEVVSTASKYGTDAGEHNHESVKKKIHHPHARRGTPPTVVAAARRSS